MSAIDDLVTNGEVTQGDLIKARAELAALRASLATATRTAEVWERQHKEIVSELATARQEILQLSAGEYLLREIGAALDCAPTSDILKRIAEREAL